MTLNELLTASSRHESRVSAATSAVAADSLWATTAACNGDDSDKVAPLPPAPPPPLDLHTFQGVHYEKRTGKAAYRDIATEWFVSSPAPSLTRCVVRTSLYLLFIQGRATRGNASEARLAAHCRSGQFTHARCGHRQRQPLVTRAEQPPRPLRSTRSEQASDKGREEGRGTKEAVVRSNS